MQKLNVSLILAVAFVVAPPNPSRSQKGKTITRSRSQTTLLESKAQPSSVLRVVALAVLAPVYLARHQGDRCLCHIRRLGSANKFDSHGRHDATGSVIRWCFADPAIAKPFATVYAASD